MLCQMDVADLVYWQVVAALKMNVINLLITFQ